MSKDKSGLVRPAALERASKTRIHKGASSADAALSEENRWSDSDRL